jgi:hypothetical protein
VGEFDVQIVRGVLPDGVELAVTQAKVVPTNSGEGWIANVGAVIRNSAPLVIEGAVGTVQALDSEGRPVASADLSFVDTYEPAVYQGDRADAEMYLRGTTAAGMPTSLVVEMVRVDAVPGTRSLGEPIELTWKALQPASVAAEITRREGGECTASRKRTQCGGVFVVENSGTTPIEVLELLAHFGDSGPTNRVYAVAARGRALLPGERQPFRVSVGLDAPAPEGPWHFEVLSVRTP